MIPSFFTAQVPHRIVIPSALRIGAHRPIRNSLQVQLMKAWVCWH